MTLPYDSQDALRARLADVAPHLKGVDGVQAATWMNGQVGVASGSRLCARGGSCWRWRPALPPCRLQVWKAAPTPGAATLEPLRSPIDNFFMTDAISRASATMAKCVQARQSMLYGEWGAWRGGARG